MSQFHRSQYSKKQNKTKKSKHIFTNMLDSRNVFNQMNNDTASDIVALKFSSGLISDT